MYTSGTTGAPKGVVIKHESLANIIHSQKCLMPIDKNTKVLQFASHMFDVALSEIFTSLTSGSCLFIASNQERQSPKLLTQYLIQNRINTATIPPAVLVHLNASLFPDLKTVITGGEPCTLTTMEHWALNRCLIHGYGPTETTFCATMNQFKHGDLSSNIGKPLLNTKVYVLDRAMMPVPQGVVGELYISGMGISLGYLNNAKLTEACFLKNPFSKSERDRMLYKTGDFVRWLAHGELEYLGRNDAQLKIRGYRVELSEIEHILSLYRSIKQSMVLQYEDERSNHQYLIAFYVATAKIEASLLWEHIKQYLPEYMFPRRFIFCTAFPRTEGGKVDIRALKNKAFSMEEAEATQISEMGSPRDLKHVFSEIWKKVIGLEVVGIHDDFFRIGGHSLMAAEIAEHMNRVENISIDAHDIFKHRTIDNICKALEQSPQLPSKQFLEKEQKMPVVYAIPPSHYGYHIYENLGSRLSSSCNMVTLLGDALDEREKLLDLSALAHHYIQQLNVIDETPIHLLGWSFGGQIALEVAYQLEQKGIHTINVYLLDTFLFDEYQQKLTARCCYNDNQYGYTISGKLFSTNILLVKAGSICTDQKSTEARALSEYNVSIKDNHIQAISDKKMRIETIACNHNNILEQTEILATIITSLMNEESEALLD